MLARLDHDLLYAMRTRWHGPRAEAAARLLGKAANYGAIWIGICTALALLDGDNRESWLIAACLGPAAVVINFAIKILVRRPRPELDGLPLLGGAPSSLSFPSAHATSSFAVATMATRIAPAAAVLFVLATAISLGRPYLGMHYPSDVLAGAAFGVALGLLVGLEL